VSKKLQKLAKVKKETKVKEPFSKMISRERVETIRGVNFHQIYTIIYDNDNFSLLPCLGYAKYVSELWNVQPQIPPYFQVDSLINFTLEAYGSFPESF
jgi:hypothetical protein